MPDTLTALATRLTAHPATTTRSPRPLILASSSPYRRELLSRLRYPFTVATPDIDESPLANEQAPATALRLAREKAEAVMRAHPGSVVIGSDQVAVCDAQQLGKPGNHARALAQLQFMRGKTVRFHTAVCVLHPDDVGDVDSADDSAGWRGEQADIVTDVRFRDLPDTVFDAYLLAETPYDVAGSAKVEGFGIALLDSVQSEDPTALIGLPLITLTAMLARAGIDLFSEPRAELL